MRATIRVLAGLSICLCAFVASAGAGANPRGDGGTDPLAALGVKFPAAVRIEASEFAGDAGKPTGRCEGEFRPGSVVCQRWAFAKPAGKVPIEWRLDTQSETVVLDPGTRRAVRMKPFLPNVGMSAVESIVAPYGFVRLARWMAERGDALTVLNRDRESVVSLPAPARGRPGVDMTIDASTGRIVSIVARGARSVTTYELSDYRVLKDGTAFPFRCETRLTDADGGLLSRNTLIYEVVEPIDPIAEPPVPAFDATIVIDDTLSGVRTDGDGRVMSTLDTPQPVGGMGPRTWNQAAVAGGVLCLLIAAAVWRRNVARG